MVELRLEVGKTYVTKDYLEFEIITSFKSATGNTIFVSNTDDYLFYEDGACFHGINGFSPHLVSVYDQTKTSRRILNRWGVSAEEAINTLRKWGEHIFGPVEPTRIVERAQEEMDELALKVVDGWTDEAVEEAADVVVILTRAPGLWEAILRKMNINFDRKWDLKGDGTGYHIPENDGDDP